MALCCHMYWMVNVLEAEATIQADRDRILEEVEAADCLRRIQDSPPRQHQWQRVFHTSIEFIHR